MTGPVVASVWLLARLVALSALGATAWALGSLLIARIPTRAEERLPLALAVGLAGWGHLLWILAGASLLRPWTVATVAVAVHLAATDHWRRVLPRLRHGARRAAGPVGALGLVLIAPSAVLALYPPTEFDALVYHLPYAGGFVATGTLPFFETLLFPSFPAHHELLFAGMMLFGTDVDAQLVSLLTFSTTALLLWTWGHRSGGSVGGAVAAGLWIGTPLVAWHAGTAYVDLALALYGGASLYALERSREESREGWAALTAFFAATAAAVKVLGLFFVGWVGLVFLVSALRRPQARRSVARGLVVLVLVTAAWYGRTAALTGNPIFPFYPEIFGSSAWTPPSVAKRDATGLVDSTVRTALEGLDDVALLPWDMLARRERYNDQAPFNPWFLVLLPLAIVPALSRRKSRRLLLPVGMFLLAWTLTTREPRFVLAVLPVLGVALGCGLELVMSEGLSKRRGITFAALLLIAAPGSVYGAWKIGLRDVPPATLRDREVYLAARVPGYGATAWLNQRFRSRYTAVAWKAPWLVYHARGVVLASPFGPYSPTSILRQLPGATESLAALRSLGVEWVIETDDWYGRPQPLPAALRVALEPRERGAGWTLYRVPSATEMSGLSAPGAPTFSRPSRPIEGAGS